MPGAGAASPVARWWAMSAKIQGRPCAARPIMTASAPSSERFAAGQALQRPADVLPRASHAGKFSVEAIVVVEVLEQPALDLGDAGRRRRFAGGEVVGDVGEDPGPPLRGAADHDRVRAEIG